MGGCWNFFLLLIQLFPGHSASQKTQWGFHEPFLLLRFLVVFSLSSDLPRPTDKHQALNINKSKNPVTCMMNIPAGSVLKVYASKVSSNSYQTKHKCKTKHKWKHKCKVSVHAHIMQDYMLYQFKFTLTLCRVICYINFIQLKLKRYWNC